MARRAATFDELLKKPARTKDLVLKVPADDNGVLELVVTLRAIGSKAYDDMLAGHPPTREQKADGASYNSDTFAPALISACSVSPSLTVDEARQIWESDEWSRGELMELFMGCVEVNNKGLDVPFTEDGSGTTTSST